MSGKKEDEEKNSFVNNIWQTLQKIFYVHSSYLVMFLWLMELALSGIKVITHVPESYFSYKGNFFNQYFVKLAWGWTLVTTGSYMIVTSFVHGGDSWKKTVILSVLRLFVGTLLWHFWANIVFHYIHDITGLCLDKETNPKFDVMHMSECIQLKQGHYWDGFDISGHTFLLTFCILLMNSEIQIQKRWNKIPTSAAQFLPIGSKALANIKSRYKFTTFLVNILFFMNCCLMLLWLIMIVSTCLYFHTFYSKALGGSCAIFSWMITYNEWYKCRLSPGLPGKGPLNGLFQKIPSKNN